MKHVIRVTDKWGQKICSIIIRYDEVVEYMGKIIEKYKVGIDKKVDTVLGVDELIPVIISEISEKFGVVRDIYIRNYNECIRADVEWRLYEMGDRFYLKGRRNL